MSIFLKVTRFASEPVIMRLKGLHHTIGEDHRGVLTSENLSKSFFSIYSIDNRYLLKIEEDSCQLNGASIYRGNQTWIAEGDALVISDYQFLFIPTSSSVELLSADTVSMQDVMATDLENDSDLPSVSFHLGNLSRTYRIFKNIKFDIGSNSENSICIKAPDVRKRHCSLTYIDGKVNIAEIDGKVSTSNSALDNTGSICKDTYLKLEPSNIELKISFNAPASKAVLDR